MTSQFSRQIAAFRTAANVTHARYGLISHPAGRDRRANSTSVTAIASHSAAISTSAHPGRRAARRR